MEVQPYPCGAYSGDCALVEEARGRRRLGWFLLEPWIERDLEHAVVGSFL